MASTGLDFVLTANSTQMRQELSKVRQESQSTALAITNLFSGDTVNAVGFKLARGVITGLIADIDEMNAGLSLSESLTRNLAASFGDMGDIALLQLGQIASFLGDDLFQTPLAGLQTEALERVGLGQLEGAFKVITAGSNAAKVLETALGGVVTGLNAVDAVLGDVQGNAQTVATFFKTIAGNAQLASSILVGTARVIDTVIEQLLDTLAEINPAFKQTREAAKALGIEFSVGQAIFGDYINDLNRLDDAARTAANASDQIADGAESARRGIDSAGNTIDDFTKKLEAQQKAAEGFEAAIRDLADAGQLLDIYNQVNGVFENLTGSLEENFNSAKGAENLRNRLELVSTSAGGAAEDLQFVGGMAEDLGVNFNAAAQGYVQFSTAANLANLSVEQTKSVFEGVTQATSVMGLSTADTQGVFLALQQTLSSGNVQLEELNQIAERVPGTFQAAAAALGVTTRELKGLISSGKVDSASFLPKFAEQLKSFTEAGVVDAMNSGEAAVNRFNNALEQFQIAAGQAWLDVGTPALNAFAEALKFAAKNEELFSTAIDAILVASLPLFISSMGKASMAVIQFIAANKTATLSIFGQQISATAAQIGKFGAQVALSYAAVILFYRVMDRAKDSAETTRSAIASLDKSLLELQSSGNGAGNALTNALPKEPPPLDWLDAGVKGLKDLEQQGGLAGKALGVLVNATPLSLNKIVNFFKTGNFEIVTAGEKALNDQMVAIGDFAQKAQAVLGESLSFRQTAKQGEGPLKELKDLEAALKRIEEKRLKTDPKDKNAIAALAKEEEELLKQRADAQKEVLANQTAINNALTQAKQELQNLDPSKLGTEGYEQAKQQLEVQINLLEKEKVAFDELTKQAKVTADSISTEFEKSTNKLDTAFANTQADLEESLASRKISEEEYRRQQLADEKKYLEDQLKLKRETATKLKTELERNSKLKASDPSKATLTDEQEKERKEQVEKIELDIAKTRLDIAKNTQAEKKELNSQELEDIRNTQAEAAAVAKNSENDRIAEVKRRLADGKVSEEDAAKEIADIQKQAIKDQIQAEKDKLTELETLKETGVLTAKEAAEQEREITSNISQLTLEQVEAEVKAKQDANNKEIKDFEDGLKRTDAAIKQSQANRKKAIAEGQLKGASSEETAQQELELQQQTTAQTLALKQKEFAQNQDYRARGVRSAKEASEIETRLAQEISELKLQQVQSEIKAQQDLLAAIGDRAKDEIQLANNAEAEKVAGIKEAQAARILDEKEAARQIAEVNRANAEETLRIKQEELARTQEERRTGELTIEAAAEREKQLIGEIAQARQQAADAQIAQQEQAKQHQIDAIETRMEAERVAAEVRQGQDEIYAQSMQDQSALLDAQLGLLQAQTSLTQQRLQHQIETAEKAGDTVKAEQLRKQLLDEQIRAQEKQAKLELQQLQLKQQQRAFDIEREQRQARIAVREAEIELIKARINGASAEEIANLQAILGLRNEQVAAINRQAAAQGQLNKMEMDSLKLKQQQTAESQKQQRIEASGGRETSRTITDTKITGERVVSGTTLTGERSEEGRASLFAAGGTTKPPSLGGDSGLSGGSKTASVGRIANKLATLGRNGDLSTALSAATAGLSLKTGFTDVNQFGASIGASNNGEIIGKLNELIQVNKQNAARPHLSISNVNDLGMAGRIYGDISRDSMRSAGL